MRNYRSCATIRIGQYNCLCGISVAHLWSYFHPDVAFTIYLWRHSQPYADIDKLHIVCGVIRASACRGDFTRDIYLFCPHEYHRVFFVSDGDPGSRQDIGLSKGIQEAYYCGIVSGCSDRQCARGRSCQVCRKIRASRKSDISETGNVCPVYAITIFICKCHLYDIGVYDDHSCLFIKGLYYLLYIIYFFLRILDYYLVCPLIKLRAPHII